ncbi:MAG: DUF4433 domain-containing protein [Burkholderiaceae bacterium]|nr:DUF4433 domain-containing protein [Microbacteriaceae bacterium]
MTEECIHGLDLDRCDICSPKAAVTTETATRAPRQVKSPRLTSLRTPAAGAAAPVGVKRSTPIVSSKPGIDIGEQRMHHVTHLSNLPSILSSGIHADQSPLLTSRPTVDVSSADNRTARRSTPVAGETGSTVADYVPFYLSPQASLWADFRSGTADPRFSPEASARPASEYVILVSTAKTLAVAAAAEQVRSGEDLATLALAGQDDSVVTTDGDAADPRTRFGATGDSSTRMLQRIVTVKDSEELLEAEFLVKGSVAFESITLIGVANDRARDAVKVLLATSKYKPRVVVHPPWFAVASDPID